MIHKTISSGQNPLIKHLALLQEKSRERKKWKQFVIEGLREISLAIKGGYEIHQLLFCTEIIDEKDFYEFKKSLKDTVEFIEITTEIYQKLAYRSSTEGVLAVVNAMDLDISKFNLAKTNPLILIAEALEKPGNIGALLRTADAAKVDAVIIANPKTDLYNPNIIRSSVGCLFTNAVFTGDTAEILSVMKSHKVNIYCAALQASISYHMVDFTGPSAIVVGTEDIGLSDAWLHDSTQNIVIPMAGEIDSLNVSVAAGILIFEAKRQRGF